MDVVVTVPKRFTWDGAPGKKGLAAWIAEGDAAGDEWTGDEYTFTMGGQNTPTIGPGQRVYIVCENMLRGYAPLIRLERDENEFHLIRGGGAVAVTLPRFIRGFQGFRYRWWDYKEELRFSGWKNTLE